MEPMPSSVQANGGIAAWQEVSVGSEVNGLRLLKLMVDVGDEVRRGQLLAVFDATTIKAELDQSRAAVEEAAAALAQASDSAKRANRLRASGTLSEQQVRQYATEELIAAARLESARATARLQQVRVDQARVVAPDDGVISARSATLGTVLPAGQEIVRLVLRNRLEWRAEIAAARLAAIEPGQLARLTPVGGEAIEGLVRVVAPTIDPQTRNGIVYVDLPPGSVARAGMFARGEVRVGAQQVMALPQRAVVLRDGFSYVMRIGADSSVLETKVQIGRRANGLVEIVSGLDPNAQVVDSGAAFLADGDLVRVVDALRFSPATPSAGR
jgi:RND family efflux transporter MFP subunit